MERSVTYTGLLLLLSLHHACSTVVVVVPSSNSAFIGSTTLLPCSFTVDRSPLQMTFLAILWYYGDKMLLRYDNKGMLPSARMSIDQQAVTKGNASLSIHNVAISDQGTYKCIIIYSPDRQEKEIVLKTQAAPVVKIYKRTLHKNKENRLLCSIADFFPRDVNVTWLRNGQALTGSVMEKYQMNADGTYNVNSSVSITPTQTHNNTDITCQVEHESLQNPIQDNFTADFGMAPKVELLSYNNGNEQTFVCEALSFAPEAVKISWLLDGKETESSRRNADGSYNNWQLYRIDGNRAEGKKNISNISCLVEHETLENTLTETWTMKATLNSERVSCAGDIVTAIFLTMVITLGAAAAALWFLIYKKKYFQEFQVSPIHKTQRWADDDKETFCCVASNCRKDIQVTWTVTEDGGEKVTVSDSQTHSDGESGRLLSTYTVITDQSQVDGLYNAISRLSFTPTLSKHKRMEIACKFLCDGKSMEKHMQWGLTILRPRLSAPIQLSLCDSGDILCSMALEKFYPRDIRITWSCGVGHYQELGTATDRIIKHTDYTFNAGSECRVPGHLFRDPGFRVRVTWRHESMDEAESREVCVTDLPWRPVMDDIVTPTLLHSTEAKLQCRIRGYYPGDLGVTWMRREAGKQELYEVSPSDRYKIPVMEITQEPDKTYTCTASLIVAVSAVTEHGSEFICRVTHPTLVTPQEKRTGELRVTGIPAVRNVLQDGGYIILEVDSYYPQDLGVSWGKGDSESGPYYRILDSDIENSSCVSSDGTYRLVSVCEAMDMGDKMNPSDIYFKATVEHEALKMPEVLLFLRRARIFYLISEQGKRPLQKGDRKTVANPTSNHHPKSEDGTEAKESDKIPV
ncbi:uncharacterized protein LOC134945845 isoform X2 [Pseudophryne corroboree]|uniref:uncharacterized protein LOC134945845 isoform X2 n=1 Tax=Pseudophryne corroboree TaxID=495146 RepID=UPI003081C776